MSKQTLLRAVRAAAETIQRTAKAGFLSDVRAIRTGPLRAESPLDLVARIGVTRSKPGTLN